MQIKFKIEPSAQSGKGTVGDRKQMHVQSCKLRTWHYFLNLKYKKHFKPPDTLLLLPDIKF